jgi:hypothetical protein
MYPCITCFIFHVSMYPYIYPWCMQKISIHPLSSCISLFIHVLTMVFSMFLIKIQKCYCMMGITFNVNKKTLVFKTQSPFACSYWYLPSSINGDPTFGIYSKEPYLKSIWEHVSQSGSLWAQGGAKGNSDGANQQAYLAPSRTDHNFAFTG